MTVVKRLPALKNKMIPLKSRRTHRSAPTKAMGVFALSKNSPRSMSCLTLHRSAANILKGACSILLNL